MSEQVQPRAHDCALARELRFEIALLNAEIGGLKADVERLTRERDEARAEIERLKADIEQHIKLAADQQQEIERLCAEIQEWRECARYDPTMDGPCFKGWDRSQMDRCRKRFIEARP